MKLSEIWSNFNTTAKLLLIFASLLTIGSVFRSCNSQSNLEKFREEYATYRDSVQLTLNQADSLNRLAQAQRDSAAKALAKSDSISQQLDSLAEITDRLHQRNDSLTQVVLSDTTTPPLVKQVIAGLTAENDSLRSQLDLAKERDEKRLRAIALFRGEAETQKNRADELEDRLRRLPQGPKSEKLLGLIPLPSRTTSFFVGVGVGVVASSLTDRYLGNN